MKLIGDMLDHMLDQMLNHIFLSFVTTALYIGFMTIALHDNG